MEYYRILDQKGFPNHWGLEDINVDDDEIFTAFQPLNIEEFRNLEVKPFIDGVPLDYTQTGTRAVPIVSEKFADVLYEYKEDIQLLPIKVVGYRGQYYILVVTHGLDCIDDNRSDFEIYEEGNDIRPDLVGDYMAFYELKIDTRKVDRAIFRLEKYNLPVILNEEIKSKLEISGLVGLKFTLVS